MNTKRSMTILALVAIFAVTLLAPGAAMASHQSNKNMWRNLAIGSGVIAGYGLVKHNSTATILGAAGAGYSAYRYEQERKAEAAQSRARDRYYYRHRFMRYHRTAHYHRTYRPASSYTHAGRKYYHFAGHTYYENLHTGSRVRVY